jgi:hypothetical protein
MIAGFLLLAALGQQPVPRPFPQPSGQPARPQSPPPASQAPAPPPASTPPAAPAQPAAAAPPRSDGGPSDAVLGVQVYPGAQFLTSFDAGRGQRFYLFGSTATFTDLVTWYRTVLKQRGELIFDAPATHEFDIGRFREETMAFPPSVTIKEYKSEISEGYPNPKAGAQPARFPTVIQIVPAVPEK